MNRDEAKYILRAYRADEQDASDPLFQAALALAKRDPELAQWFAEEQALDIPLARKIRTLPVPPGLKAQLLAARKVVPLPRWWQRPALRAAAAGFVLLLGLGIFLVQQSAHRDFGQGRTLFAQYRDTMADFSGNKLWRLDHKSRDVQEIRRWLTQKNAHGDLLLPAGLDGRPGIGCRVLDWNGTTISLICLELADHRKAHLLVIDRATFPDAPGETPQFAQVGRVGAIAWSRADKTYVLACQQGTEAELRRLL